MVVWHRKVALKHKFLLSFAIGLLVGFFLRSQPINLLYIDILYMHISIKDLSNWLLIPLEVVSIAYIFFSLFAAIAGKEDLSGIRRRVKHIPMWAIFALCISFSTIAALGIGWGGGELLKKYNGAAFYTSLQNITPSQEVKGAAEDLVKQAPLVKSDDHWWEKLWAQAKTYLFKNQIFLLLIQVILVCLVAIWLTLNNRLLLVAIVTMLLDTFRPPGVESRSSSAISLTAKGVSVRAQLRKVVELIWRFAPFAICLSLALKVAQTNIIVPFVLAGFLGLLAVVLLLFVLALFYQIPIRQFARLMWEPLIIAITTRSSEIAFPLAAQNLRKLNISEGVINLTLPLSYCLSLMGSTMYLPLATIFVGQSESPPVSLGLVKITELFVTSFFSSKGIALLPQASLIVLAGILKQLGLQAQKGIELILLTDLWLDFGRTAVNLIGACLTVVVVNYYYQKSSSPRSKIIVHPKDSPSSAVASIEIGIR